ncbi:unnamed protein product [Timema podura]|uniref:poly(ADP-ribose) glycohydrolase n=1 Tax=Timema podura TaxID=61482 RepID=A0ABN7NFW1_TIMPD|nr:unnamed protein product [Timema podura]
MSYPDVALQIEDDLETEESASPPSVASWRGTAMSELKNRYSPGLPPVQASANHAVLFQLPVSPGSPLKPYPHVSKDRWDSLHVRMPSSSLSLYPVENAGKDGEEKQLRPRWELVQEALLRPITSSKQLQDAIFSYNSKYMRALGFLHTRHIFLASNTSLRTILGTRESTKFFSTLLPQIIGLALQLPSLVTGPIPLLVQNRNQSVSLTQLQVASLLANAFLCTFPRRNTAKRFSEYYKYPDINFNRLFHSSQKRFSCCIEKLRCLIHYFHRVCTKSPVGVLTYSRQYLSPSQLPDWTISKKFLPHLHISSSGTIEKEGDGFLQVDFANKMVGGGVLGSGCVQEEIRFIICPELIVSRLFTEELNSTEALIVTGCERYSNYVGYGDTFEWLGDYVDTTPRDSSGRRLCTVAAIDALNLPSVTAQFAPNCLRRELNKAYTGFLGMGLSADKLSPVATGNWGCGAFRGDAHLKALLQLMAAGQADRDLVYFTFGDTQLRDDVYEIHAMLTNHGITVGQLAHASPRTSPMLVKLALKQVPRDLTGNKTRAPASLTLPSITSRNYQQTPSVSSCQFGIRSVPSHDPLNLLKQPGSSILTH